MSVNKDNYYFYRNILRCKFYTTIILYNHSKINRIYIYIYQLYNNLKRILQILWSYIADNSVAIFLNDYIKL